VMPVAAPIAPIATDRGAWEAGAAGGKWTLRGKNAPPLVVRGVLEPIHADSNMSSCPAVLGARHGTTPLSLEVGGEPRTLYVFAKARGPIGIGASYSDCAVAGANAWTKLAIPNASGDVSIPIMDVDVEGERRGQTSPYVVVVSEVDEEPKLEPEPRAPVRSSDLVVRWNVTPRACAPEIAMFSCSSATLEITDAKGKLVTKMPLKGGLTGQLGCWPEGTGVHCGGPSGMTVYTVEPAKDGSGEINIATTSQSDGYCPPPEDCTTRMVLAKSKVPIGARLVPDPKGTFPPAPSASERK
jgi:hypothetical protein